MVSLYHSLESLREILWDPEILKNIYPKCHDDDNEILKASLMLQSVLVKFKEVQIERKRMTASLKSLADEKAEILSRKYDLELQVTQLQSECNLLQSECNSLQSECNSLRTKLESTLDCKDSVTAELNRLQQQLAQKVDERAKSIFMSCLKKNSATTVLDWMTQMHLQTQLTHDENTFEQVTNEEDFDSPDLISATPEPEIKDKKRKQRLKISNTREKLKDPKIKKLRNSALLSSTPVSKKYHCISSPDEIPDTPNVNSIPKYPLSNSDKNKIHKISSSLQNNGNRKLNDILEKPNNYLQTEQEIVVSLDTQEMAPEASQRPNEGIVIPETFDPQNVDMEIGKLLQSLSCSSNSKDDLTSCKSSSRSIADTSIDVDFPNTPKKGIKPHNIGSPILGSGHKIHSQKAREHLETSVHVSPPSLENKSVISQGSTGARKKIWSSKLSLDKNKFAIEKESRLQKGKKYYQTVLSFPNCNKLSRDISLCGEFNGGQRHSKSGNNISENVDANAGKRNSKNTSANDSDATFFDEPDLTKSSRENVNSMNIQKSTSGPVFQPMFTSTEKRMTSPKDMRHTNSHSHRARSRQQLSLGMKCDEFESEFNPLWSSTEKEPTENTHLNQLVGMLNDEDKGTPLETSFDRLPRKRSPSPSYKYKGNPVRKKSERLMLNAWDCPDCQEFNRCAGYDPDDPATRNLLGRCSRHRSKHGPRRQSPEGFWDLDHTLMANPVKQAD